MAWIRIIPIFSILASMVMAMPMTEIVNNETHVSIVLELGGGETRVIVFQREFEYIIRRVIEKLIDTILRAGENQTIDINECVSTANLDECDNVTEICVDIIGSHRCVCAEGYIVSSTDNRTCVADPCTNATCGQNSNCTALNDTAFSCDCESGFEQKNDMCVDIDECATGNVSCHSNASCVNEEGGYTCQCQDGFSGDGKNCTEVDQCATGTADCDDDATCDNTGSSYTCTCKSGYTGNGVNCSDIDECTTGVDGCSPDANCANTDGGHSCTCRSGFSGPGETCTNIDECAENTDNCPTFATCTDTEGSFNCSCNDGFQGNGIICSDIDECTRGTHMCHEMANCTNTDGSHTCTCQDGFSGDGSNCENVDECNLGTDPCGENEMCSDTEGSYECSCMEGFTSVIGNCISDEMLFEASLRATATSRKKRATRYSNVASEIEMDLRMTFLAAGFDTNVTVYVLNVTNATGGGSLFSVLLQASPEALIVAGTALDDLEGQTLGGFTFSDISYSSTETFTGSITFSASSNETQFCNQIEREIDLALKNLYPGDTANINCTFTSLTEFEVVVTGTLADSDQLREIILNVTSFGYITDVLECSADLMNDCDEFAQCRETVGSFTCECNNDKHDNNIANPGRDCVNPIVDITCGEDRVTIRLYVGYFMRIGSNVNQFHLLDTACTGKSDGRYVTFTSGFDECGTTGTLREDDVIYQNSVTNIRGGFQPYNPAIDIGFTCKYSKSFESSGDEDDIPSVILVGQIVITFNDSETGELVLMLAAYESASFDTRASPNASVGDTIYLEANHSTTLSNVFLKLTRCWVTPVNERDSTISQNILQNGCPVTGISGVTIISNGMEESARFSYTLAAFESSNQLFIHCAVELCESACAPTCSKRRRREARNDDENVLTIGPIEVEEPSAPDPQPGGDDDDDIDENNSVVTTTEDKSAVVGISVALVIAVCIIGVLVFIRYRRGKNRW